MENKIPLGSTCHYERIEGKWYVVWAEDFEGDGSGKELVDGNEKFYLECGYEVSKSELKSKESLRKEPHGN